MTRRWLKRTTRFTRWLEFEFVHPLIIIILLVKDYILNIRVDIKTIVKDKLKKEDQNIYREIAYQFENE